MSDRLFTLGVVVATPGALQLLDGDCSELLRRHASGDWGDLSRADAKENDLSVRRGFRIFSAYETDAGKVWIITEADRSSTCILLPSEY